MTTTKAPTSPTLPSKTSGPQSLFNGVDLTHWNRYLGKPTPVGPPLGLDRDPKRVFSVTTVDGAPALRISGEVWGALISQEQYCDFELHLEYKWGVATWPPLNALDSGIMLLSTGPFGAVNAGGNALSDPAGSGAFVVSLEYQLVAGDIGAMYNLGPITFVATSRVAGSERANAWNDVTIVHRDDVVTFSLNDEVVATGSDFQLAWPGELEGALKCGKLQLQSEGGEIFFRNIEIEPLP